MRFPRCVWGGESVCVVVVVGLLSQRTGEKRGLTKEKKWEFWGVFKWDGKDLSRPR